MFEALQPHPEDHLHLRLHRARSVILTAQELTEIRAAQRTFEGAYMRTALSQFSFALIILKIFTREFYAIGALFAAYGAAVLLVAIFRRYEGNRQFFDQEESDSETEDESSSSSSSPVMACSNTATTSIPSREENENDDDDDDDDDQDGGRRSEMRCSRRTTSAPRPRRRRRVQTIKKKFRTSGNSVTLLTLLSLSAYITLLVLTLRLST